MSCKLKKNTWGPNSPLSVLYFKDCVMITCVWFWYFLSSTYSWGYIGWGPLSGYLKSFVLSFLFCFISFLFSFSVFLFLFFFLSLSLSLSEALLLQGPLDIVHPCHPVATPLGRFYMFDCPSRRNSVQAGDSLSMWETWQPYYLAFG